jgi:serine/threonine protein kinase
LITDFGLSRYAKNGLFTLLPGRKRSSGEWLALELWTNDEKSNDYTTDDSQSPQQSHFSVAVDAWALGCLFFHFCLLEIIHLGETTNGFVRTSLRTTQLNLRVRFIIF